jgi:L-rhamnose mutarotase
MNWSDLNSRAFILTIRPGAITEYKRRHDAIWPRMVEALRASGVVYYDIYLHEPTGRVFGHMIRDRVPDPSEPEHPAVLEWRRYMADVLEMDGDRPRTEPIERVFHLTA